MARINGLTAGAQSLGHDVLDVRGRVSLGGATLQPSVGFASAVGNQYVIVSNDGTDAVQGAFAGLAEGAFFQIGTLRFSITYRGGDGNDVVLRHENSASAFAERTVPRRFPPGVYRHRSIADAERLREEWQERDFQALWRRRGVDPERLSGNGPPRPGEG